MHCPCTFRQLSAFEQLEISVVTETATLQEELGYLKALWDMVGAVMFTFTDWYSTLWDKIDVDFLVEETKKLTKDIKQLNKAVRNYEVYRYGYCLLCSRCLFFPCATKSLCVHVLCFAPLIAPRLRCIPDTFNSAVKDTEHGTETQTDSDALPEGCKIARHSACIPSSAGCLRSG